MRTTYTVTDQDSVIVERDNETTGERTKVEYFAPRHEVGYVRDEAGKQLFDRHGNAVDATRATLPSVLRSVFGKKS